MLTGVAAVGQVDRAVLEGTVIDPSGAAIAGAHVKILAVDTDMESRNFLPAKFRRSSDGGIKDR
jgi:hypothetical protein